MNQPHPQLGNCACAIIAPKFEILKFENTMSANIQRQGSDCSTSSASDSSPEQRSESRGSSVSAGLREEYEDILKYAVVAPKLLGESSTLTAPLPTTPPTERQSEPRHVMIEPVCLLRIYAN